MIKWTLATLFFFAVLLGASFLEGPRTTLTSTEGMSSPSLESALLIPLRLIDGVLLNLHPYALTIYTVMGAIAIGLVAWADRYEG